MSFDRRAPVVSLCGSASDGRPGVLMQSGGANQGATAGRRYVRAARGPASVSPSACRALPLHILQVTLPDSPWTGCTGAPGVSVRDHDPLI
jgi:hypothetical protein